jgi:hypothetical protein
MTLIVRKSDKSSTMKLNNSMDLMTSHTLGFYCQYYSKRSYISLSPAFFLSTVDFLSHSLSSFNLGLIFNIFIITICKCESFIDFSLLSRIRIVIVASRLLSFLLSCRYLRIRNALKRILPLRIETCFELRENEGIPLRLQFRFCYVSLRPSSEFCRPVDFVFDVC